MQRRKRWQRRQRQHSHYQQRNDPSQINQKNIALSLSAAPDPAKADNNVVLTATVQGAVDLPAGTVSFKNDDTTIASNVAITESGGIYTASTTWSGVYAGEYDITAVYNGTVDDNYICGTDGLISDFSITKYDQPDFAFVNGADYSISEGVIDKTYGDSVFTLNTTGHLSSGAVTYSVLTGSDVVSVDASSGAITLLKAGTAVINALSPADAIYNQANASVTIEVERAEQSGFGFAVSDVSKTYGDAPFILTATGAQSTGDISYAVTEGDTIASVDATTGELTLNQSGTAVITATTMMRPQRSLRSQWTVQTKAVLVLRSPMCPKHTGMPPSYWPPPAGKAPGRFLTR